QSKGEFSRGSCTSYFLMEAEPWMRDMSCVEGKVTCPNASCGARLGSYRWTGSQCSCEWL
ncbi:unnamed protein product, partial [Discosporangium mesarthrocarpum]